MTAAFDSTAALIAALDAAKAGSDVLMSRFLPAAGAELQTWMKRPGALVTDADIASDVAVTNVLRSSGVPARVLSEESGSGGVDTGLTWLVDPLCGTVPYSTGMVHWGVNVALRSDGRLEVGVIALPPMGETLAASRGHGVARNGRPLRPAPPGRPLAEATIGLEVDGPEMWRTLLQRGLGWVPACGQINTFASAAYPMGLVCLGRLSALVIYGVEPVHLAAGAAIALELGLHVTDGAGVPIDWSGDAELPLVVCAWPEVHARLVAAITQAV